MDEACPLWFVMENVKDAPAPHVDDYEVADLLLRDFWVGGKTLRMRRISFGTPDGRILPVEQLALHTQEPEVSALAGGGDRARPVALGGSGKPKRYGNSGRNTALGRGGSQREGLATRLRQQGLPGDFLADAPFTAAGKSKCVGNGVPLPMGRAIAKAVRRALEEQAA